MKLLKLYAPAIVLLLMSALSAIGVGIGAFAFLTLAIAVFLHVREEVQHDRSCAHDPRERER